MKELLKWNRELWRNRIIPKMEKKFGKSAAPVVMGMVPGVLFIVGSFSGGLFGGICLTVTAVLISSMALAAFC